MTDDLTYCVRGCSRNCREDECIADPASCEHELRREAEVGLLCRRCSQRLVDALDDIELMYPDLDLYATGAGDGKRTGRLSHSPALIRLDVMVLTDPDACVGDGARSVVGTLGSWARTVEEELGPKLRGNTLAEILDVLRPWHQQIASQPWVDDYWDEVIEVRAMLRRATAAPPPIARCWGWDPAKPCGRLLYPPRPGEDKVKCRRCHRTYDGSDLIKVQIQGEREGVG